MIQALFQVLVVVSRIVAHTGCTQANWMTRIVGCTTQVLRKCLEPASMRFGLRVDRPDPSQYTLDVGRGASTRLFTDSHLLL